MDKRLTSLTLLYACFLTLGLYAKATASYNWGVFSEFPISILIGLFVALVCFSVVLTILAIIDIALRRQDVDGRYFTRIFIYKSFSLLFVIFLDDFYIMDLGITKDMYVPVAVILGLIFLLPFSLHTISGLAACRKQNAVSSKMFFIHIFMQLIFFLDIMSSLFLMFDEKKSHPEERMDIYKHSFEPRPMPVPGIYGVLLAICAVLCLNNSRILANYGMSNFLFYLWGDFKRGWDFQFSALSILFSFLIAVVVRAICDAAYYLRKQPADATSRPFLNKILLFSAAALVLEVALFSLVNLTVGSLMNFTQSGDFSYRSRPVVHHVLFIALLVSSFILVHASVFLYTHFAVKCSLTARVITDKKASLFTWLSLVPVAQLVVVYFLFKTNHVATKDV